MQLIMAIIKPFRLDAVREALTALGVAGMTVTEVQGAGARVPGCDGEFVPRLKVEVLAEDAGTPAIVEAIAFAARTGRQGDGRIFVSRLAEVVRVRTGETGDIAI